MLPKLASGVRIGKIAVDFLLYKLQINLPKSRTSPIFHNTDLTSYFNKGLLQALLLISASTQTTKQPSKISSLGYEICTA